MSHCKKQSVNNIEIEFQNKKGERLECHLQEVDIQQQRIIILITHNDEISLIIKKMEDSRWLHREEYHVRFQWNGQWYQAKVGAVFNPNEITTGSEGQYDKIELQLIETTRHYEFTKGLKLFFFVPHTVPGKIKQIILLEQGIAKFEFAGRQWILRYAYAQQADSQFPPSVDIINDKSATLCGLFLENWCENSGDVHLLEKQVDEICSLLSCAIGEYAFWKTAWFAEKGEMQFYRYSSFGQMTKGADRPVLVSMKENVVHVCNPCSFISKAQAFYEYDGCSEWWRVTLLWYLHARLSDSIEVNKMIESMLFDRVTSKVFSIIVKKALGLDLCDERDNFVEKIKKPLQSKLDNALLKSPSEEDRAFLKMCCDWITGKHYIGKIKAIAAYIGISMKSNEEDEIMKRNSIMHQGELLEKLEGVMEYDDNITKYSLLLLLPLLGYGETFTTRMRHYVVSDEAKNWKRLNFLSIMEKAGNLLK